MYSAPQIDDIQTIEDGGLVCSENLSITFTAEKKLTLNASSQSEYVCVPGLAERPDQHCRPGSQSVRVLQGLINTANTFMM